MQEGLTGIERLYWKNYQNKVLPFDFDQYAEEIVCLPLNEVVQEIVSNISTAAGYMNDDLGCEHQVNTLVNSTGRAIVGMRLLLTNGVHIRFIGLRYSAMDGLDFTAQDPDQLHIGGRDCISLYELGAEESFEAPAMDEIQLEFLNLPN